MNLLQNQNLNLFLIDKFVKSNSVQPSKSLTLIIANASPMAAPKMKFVVSNTTGIGKAASADWLNNAPCIHVLKMRLCILITSADVRTKSK